MVSLYIYTINGLKKEHLEHIKNYEYLNEKEEEFNVELKQFITNYNIPEENLVNFTFTHESVTKILIGNKNHPNFHVDTADIWFSFKQPQTYLFIESSSNLEFIISEIKRIIQIQIPINEMVELVTNEINLKEHYTNIIKEDASEVLSSWFEGLNANDHSITLRGLLKDDTGTESEYYSKVNETARSQTSVSIRSKRLVNNITVSKNKLSSQNKGVNTVTLINYFEKIIFPLL